MTEPARNLFRLKAVVWGVFAALMLYNLVAIWVLNGGRFEYTLDDTYIHLAVSENIADGHYGVNSQEYSAPSSSIVWPFILALFNWTGLDRFVPFFLNLIAGIGVMALMMNFVARVFEPGRDRQRRVIFVLVSVLLMLTGNVVGLIYGGMEHSWQVLVSLLMLAGLWEEQRTGRVTWWLALAVTVAPLIRYDTMAVTAPTLLVLWARGYRRTTLISGGIIAAYLLGFSLFLLSIDQGALPASVTAKSHVVAGASFGLFSLPRALFSSLLENVFSWHGGWFIILLLALWGGALRAARRGETGDRLLAIWAAIALLLHLIAGRMGVFNRYEIYAAMVGLLTVLVLWRDILRRIVDESPLVMSALFVTLAFGLTVLYWPTSFITPLAANNIYEQQYQMHRFITDYYQGDVAVSDLGWPSYRNRNYVLDLWGLASREALEYRLEDEDGVDWMNLLMTEHDVRAAILFEERFDIPANWQKLCRLTLGKTRIAPAESSVRFYALDDETAARILALMEDYRDTLPDGTKLVCRSWGNVD